MIFCSSTYHTFSYYSDRIKKFRSKHKRPTCHSSITIFPLSISGGLQILLRRISLWEVAIQIDKADTQMHHGQQPTPKSALYLSHLLHSLENVGSEELLTACEELFTSRPGPARHLNFQSSSRKCRRQQRSSLPRKLSTSLRITTFPFIGQTSTFLGKQNLSRFLLPQLYHLSNFPSWSNMSSKPIKESVSSLAQP
jgi:hypothetical protein